MSDYLSPGECYLLDTLYERSLPTAQIHGPTLASLIRGGYAEVTSWAGRARLTPKGRDLFQVYA